MIVIGLVQGTLLQKKINTVNNKGRVLQYTSQKRPVQDRARKHFKTAGGTTLNIARTTKMMISLGPVNVYLRVFVG